MTVSNFSSKEPELNIRKPSAERQDRKTQGTVFFDGKNIRRKPGIIVSSNWHGETKIYFQPISKSNNEIRTSVVIYLQSVFPLVSMSS